MRSGFVEMVKFCYSPKSNNSLDFLSFDKCVNSRLRDYAYSSFKQV